MQYGIEIKSLGGYSETKIVEKLEIIGDVIYLHWNYGYIERVVINEGDSVCVSVIKKSV